MKKLLKRPTSFITKLLIVTAVLGICALAVVFFVRTNYTNKLKPVSQSQQVTVITVPLGATVKEIAQQLKQAELIRETWAFEWYVRNTGIREQLQAGTYALRPSMSVQEIATIMARGEITTDLVTILPGRRLDQIRVDLINSGFQPDAVDKALKASTYKGHAALVDKPANANLEGYLYPESFQKTGSTTPEDIIRASLDEMAKQLSPSIRRGFAKRNLSVYEGVTLASIIEQEVSNPADKKTVAQVFLKRMRMGMRLESDPTAFYGAIVNGQPPSLAYDSDYNTYKRDGLPPGPISNVSDLSLKAIVNPASSDYLFFVAGDDGTTHFTNTNEEHEAAVEQYCKKLCQ